MLTLAAMPVFAGSLWTILGVVLVAALLLWVVQQIGDPMIQKWARIAIIVVVALYFISLFFGLP